MGAGESVYVQKQEAFVRANRDTFKKELSTYSNRQIEGKLRQLYANTDKRKENEYSYINKTAWNNACSKIVPKHPTNVYIWE
jgi:hypothetical protein